MLISKGFRDKLSLGGQDARQEQAAADPTPQSWGTHVTSAILHVIALAQYALTYSRSWAAGSSNERVRLKAENDHLEQELAVRQEGLRLKDARMRRMAPARRPHDPPTERMAILELRAARGWSLEQTAGTFLVAADTIRSWGRRIDEAGAKALVQNSLHAEFCSGPVVSLWPGWIVQPICISLPWRTDYVSLHCRNALYEVEPLCRVSTAPFANARGAAIDFES